jgi:hypothetical protein
MPRTTARSLGSTHEVATLAGNDEDVAAAAGLDRRLEADVGEVGHGEDVHHAPGMVGGVAVELAPDRLPHGAARAVAADHVLRAHRDLGAYAGGIGAAQSDGDRAIARVADRDVHDLEVVVGFEPAR